MLQQTQSLQKAVKPKKVFLSYSHSDEQLKNLLLLTFRSLEAEGHIRTWHDRMILAGQQLDPVIRENLESSELVIFLVSRAFLESGYCRRVEMRIALRMSREQRAYVIPVILSDCNWKKEKFAKLLALPTDGQPLFNENGAPYPHRLQETVEGLRLASIGLWSHSPTHDAFGATISTSSSPLAGSPTITSKPNVELLQPSESSVPLLLKGVKVSDGGAKLDFLIDTGHTGLKIHSLDFNSERQRVTDYFWESLAVEGDLQWVNLSPYDSSRMLPKELSGTRLGRDMLAFDCQLKAFSASLLHPDSDSGRDYWREVYRRAKAVIGTSNLAFQSFHTVTVSASKAKVFVPPQSWVHEAPTQALKDFLSGSYLGAAIVVGHRLQAVCEVGENAMSHVASRQSPAPREGLARTIAADVFRETILPIIERELNEGSTFAFNRQIFLSMILASWLKGFATENSSVGEALASYVDKNRPNPKNFPTLSVTELTDTGPGAPRIIDNEPAGYVSSDDPAFRVTENVQFYRKYLDLFTRGLYRVVRTEQGDFPGQMNARVYFSGCVEVSPVPVSTVDRLNEVVLGDFGSNVGSVLHMARAIVRDSTAPPDRP